MLKQQKMAQQRRSVPPIVMKAAKQIWLRSAKRPEGQLTQRQALMAAMRLFRQRQARLAANGGPQGSQTRQGQPMKKA